MTVTLSEISNNKVSVQWKEPYISAALNKKIVPAQPRGVYRGLKIKENTSEPRQVELDYDPVFFDRVAVHHELTGHSITYVDDSQEQIILDLSDSSLDNSEVLISIKISYSISEETEAEFKAHTLSDYESLTGSEKSELVVLGTVQCGDSNDDITESDISHKNRTYPWDKTSSGLLIWSPVAQDPGFDKGTLTEDQSYSLFPWEAIVTDGDGNFETSSDSEYGNQSLRLSVTSGPFSGSVSQKSSIAVEEGNLVRVRCIKRADSPVNDGSVDIELDFVGENESSISTESMSVIINDTDGDFVEITEDITVPNGATFVSEMRVSVTGVDDGADVLFDEVQAWAEVTDPRNVYPGRLGSPVAASTLLIGAPMPMDGSTPGALVRYDAGDAGGDGAVVFDHPSQIGQGQDSKNSLGHHGPSMRVRGQLFVGDDLASGADVRKPRLSGDMPEASENLGPVLIWEGKPLGGDDRVARYYVTSDGSTIFTSNARSTGSDSWEKDVNGDSAYKLEISHSGVDAYSVLPSSDTWNDADWGLSGTNAIRIAGEDVLLSSPSDENILIFVNGGWEPVNIGEGGGDVAGGAYSSTEVRGIRGNSIEETPSPSTNDVLVFSNDVWAPQNRDNFEERTLIFPATVAHSNSIVYTDSLYFTVAGFSGARGHIASNGTDEIRIDIPLMPTLRWRDEITRVGFMVNRETGAGNPEVGLYSIHDSHVRQEIVSAESVTHQGLQIHNIDDTPFPWELTPTRYNITATCVLPADGGDLEDTFLLWVEVDVLRNR